MFRAEFGCRPPMLHTVGTTLALACIGPRTPGAFRRDRFAGAYAGYDKCTRHALAVQEHRNRLLRDAVAGTACRLW